MDITPIEQFVFDGIVKRMQQTFNCQTIFTTANDKTKTLARLREGSGVQYPYIFLTITSFARNAESYATNRLARKGVMAIVGEEQGLTVRLLPANFEIDVEFITNKYDGIEQGSVKAFARRWLFAQRCGYLKFNIMYGRLQVPIAVTMSESVPITPLENKVETESAYKITTTLTIHGWLSEPALGTEGIVTNLIVDEVMANSDGSIPNYQFIPF